MKGIIKSTFNFLKHYNQIFSISLPQKLGILFLIALIANHLNGEDSFPLNDTYEFPIASILETILLGMIQILVSDLNFVKYKNQYFINGVTKKSVFYFGTTTLFYYFLIYLPSYFLITWLIEVNVKSYDFIAGLFISLLLSIIAIIGFYAMDIYKLFKSPSLSDKLTVKNGTKTTLINPSDIAYFYSRHRIVYLVKTSNDSMATNFTLNQLETQLDTTSYFRVNRQVLAHSKAIHQVENIENGKLAIRLIPTDSQKNLTPVIISRYKKQAFLDWFHQKL